LAIRTGQRLGPYEILSAIGAGGMGEVYRARDTRLDRIVAVKILPDHLANRAELRERFDREARTVASLNHPHICSLFDIGHQDGIDFLVMEYLEGETLAERLKKALPLDQVLQNAIEIADALDKAHRKGITHRDLKPSNIMLTKSGSKLLDFGLAKLRQESKTSIPLSELPTAKSAVTVEGTILGTLQYMAPEQLEGKEADARTDIFAFGAVVYEMATGKKAFEGKSQASLIAKILEIDPPAISSLQPMMPPALDRVIKRCLSKDPENRWQTARDLELELKSVAEGPQAAAVATVNPARLLSRRNLITGLAFLVFGAILGFAVWYLKPSPALPPQPVARFVVLPPEKSSFNPNPNFVTVSPDGSKLAFVVGGDTGTSGSTSSQLWVRPLDSLSAEPLVGTEGANQPFWSADSRFLVFFAAGKLKKKEVGGGPTQILCDVVGDGGNGDWNREGVILFAPNNQASGPIYRLPAAGGSPTAVTMVDTSQGETGHLWPRFLPDGKHFIYLALNREKVKSAIRVSSIDSNTSMFLLNAQSFIQYAPPGYLLFQRDATLMAQSFDAQSLRLTGDAFPVAENVQINPANGRGAFTVSANGVLAYRGSGSLDTQLAWFDRNGKQLGHLGEAAGHISPRLSPDGKRLVFTRATDAFTPGDIWVLDLSRNTETRLTFDSGHDSSPVWSPDGSRIAFFSDRNNVYGIYQKNVNGAGQDEMLSGLGSFAILEDWSLDGRYLTLMSTDKGGRDVWILQLTGEWKLIPFLNSRFAERHSQLSPDSRWMAYVSDESGNNQIYVQRFPEGNGKWQVSTSGGVQPRWRRDGKELFYLAPDGKLMAAAVKAGTNFEAGKPEALFQTRIFGLGPSARYSQQYDLTADGQRFLINEGLSDLNSAPITVVLNWTAGLKK